MARRASEIMGRLHDALRRSGYVGHDLERDRQKWDLRNGFDVFAAALGRCASSHVDRCGGSVATQAVASTFR